MKIKKSLCLISLFQSLGLISYISLVSLVFWKGNEWFGNMNTYIGPLIVLSIFAVSALICALITLSFPFTLWQKGKPKMALRLVFYTAAWTIGFIFLFLLTHINLG